MLNIVPGGTKRMEGFVKVDKEIDKIIEYLNVLNNELVEQIAALKDYLQARLTEFDRFIREQIAQIRDYIDKKVSDLQAAIDLLRKEINEIVKKLTDDVNKKVDDIDHKVDNLPPRAVSLLGNCGVQFLREERPNGWNYVRFYGCTLPLPDGYKEDECTFFWVFTANYRGVTSEQVSDTGQGANVPYTYTYVKTGVTRKIDMELKFASPKPTDVTSTGVLGDPVVTYHVVGIKK